MTEQYVLDDIKGDINEIHDEISISEAIRRNFGKVKVKGTIAGISRTFKMISKITFYCKKCRILTDIDFPYPLYNISDVLKEYEPKCKECKTHVSKDNGLNPDYKNAILVELQDMETFNDMDRLSVFLFDRDTENSRVGELVAITGDIQIIDNNKKLFTCLYAESIQYLNREDFTLTKPDIEAIKKFGRNDFDKKYEGSVIDKLVSMFDPSIVGYDHVKKGLLMSAVNTSDDISRNERINSLLIGDPGLAKSKLAKRATKLVPKSRHESGQSSTGKSLTAIIEKTDDNTFLRPGPIPLARSAICSINELGRQSIEDQGHLLDVMEEGEFTKNAFGKSVRIKSPTTIVATANPLNNSKWRDNNKVDLSEFPVFEPIRDRFDLKFIFKDRTEDEEVSNFANKLMEIEDKKDKGQLEDYTTFVVKYIQYAKQFKPIITSDARKMLTEFYKEIKKKKFGTPRIIVTLPKIVKAIARLKLKEVADEQDAKEAMEFYNVMLVDFQKQVVISESPRDIAYQECSSLLKEVKDIGGISFEELIVKVCERNEQLANYFGHSSNVSLQIKNNKKTRNVYEMLLNHPNIKKVSEKPIVLQWLSDPSDPSDQDNTYEKNENSKTQGYNNDLLSSKSKSHRSHGSPKPSTTSIEPIKGYKLSPNGDLHLMPSEESKQMNQRVILDSNHDGSKNRTKRGHK